MTRSLPTTMLLLTLALAAGGCGASRDRQTRLTITGSSTMAPLLAEIGKRFEAERSEVRVEVQTGGSSRGIADARQGLADLGASSRVLDASEAPGMVSELFARDGVCFLVHRDNPVDGLTKDQLRDVFTGKVDNWRALGWEDAPITVINRAEGRSEIEIVSEYFGIEPAQFVADLIAGDNEQGIKNVSADPHAIIFISLGTAEYDAAHGAPIKLLALEGVPATVLTVADGSYPLSRPLLLVHRTDLAPEVEEYVALALSPAVHDLVREFGFVPPAQ